MLVRLSMVLICVLLVSGCNETTSANSSSSSNSPPTGTDDSTAASDPDENTLASAPDGANAAVGTAEDTPDQKEDVATRPTKPLLPAPTWRPEHGAGPIKAGVNLVNDPSLEGTAASELYPKTWGHGNLIPKDAWRFEVVEGGRTGERAWMIEGDGTAATVPSNRPPIDRAFRYAARAWVKVESGMARLGLLYFDKNGRYISTSHSAATTSHGEWQRLTMIDDFAEYPDAAYVSLALVMVNKGKAVFDDLEMVAFEADKLPEDFAAEYGGVTTETAAVFDRWVGRWESTTLYKPTTVSPDEQTIKGQVVVRKILDDRFLLWQWVAEGGQQQYISILGFDEHAGGYHIWLFGSGGEVYERIGQWDMASQTLTLQVKPPSSGVMGTSTDRFVDTDRIESTLLVKANGQVTRDMHATWVRKSSTVSTDIDVSSGPVAGSEELALLYKMAGQWSIKQTMKPSFWFPEGGTETIAERADWAIGGRFLMFRSYGDQQHLKTLALMTWDEKEKSYHYWHFANDVAGGQWRITWDAVSRGFQWRSIDMPTGWIGTGFNRWVDDDTFDNQVLIKDDQGRVLMDSHQKRTRIK